MSMFKRPELSDRRWVEELLAKESSRACEHNFANIWLWSGAYPQKIARVGDRLLVQMLGGIGLSHLFPMGSGPLAPALEQARADAQSHGVPLTLICVTREQKEQLEREFPGRFVFEEDRAGWDYLYDARKMAELSGKKLHSKRNHIHRFCDRYPDWMFEPVGGDNLAQCGAMAAEWYRRQEAEGRMDATLRRERQAVEEALTHMDELGLVGGLIRAEGAVVAFALASRTTADCCNIHVEKAFGDIQGAYTVIAREMARWLVSRWPETVWLNREDDMGLDGLRKAKLSYYPDQMIEKYSAREG